MGWEGGKLGDDARRIAERKGEEEYRFGQDGHEDVDQAGEDLVAEELPPVTGHLKNLLFSLLRVTCLDDLVRIQYIVKILMKGVTQAIKSRR